MMKVIEKATDKIKYLKNRIYNNNVSLNKNGIYYIAKRYKWTLDLKRYFYSFDEVDINKPIFIIGTKGAGLTLVSRMIRRSEDIVHATGNNKYWSGPAETHTVLGPILPKPLKGPEYLTPYPDGIRVAHGWHTGLDRYVSKYRSDHDDVTEKAKKKYTNIIKWVIYKYGNRGINRFLDKSQVYALKVGYLDELLSGCSPKFVLVTRNPYAICYREAKSDVYSEKYMKESYDLEDRLSMASEHWKNYVRIPLSDKKNGCDLIVVKMENVISNTKRSVKKICKHCDLNYRKRMIPSKDDRVPIGTRSRNKWYPVKLDINDEYLNNISRRGIEIVKNKCGKLANKLGYQPHRH